MIYNDLDNKNKKQKEIVYISQENEEETLLILKINKEISELSNYRKFHLI